VHVERAANAHVALVAARCVDAAQTDSAAALLQETQLLERSKAFDAAFRDRDRAAVEALFAPDVTVHKGMSCSVALLAEPPQA